MSTTYKFKVAVVIKLNPSSSPTTIYPIIEAPTSYEAEKIAKAQYPTGRISVATKVN